MNTTTKRRTKFNGLKETFILFICKDEYMFFSDILEDEKEQAREIGLAEGREKGIAEGRAEGQSEARIEDAKKLLKLNLLTIEQIAQAQGLSVEKVKELAEE